MAGTIHPTAIIEPGATLGDRVLVGAYAYIGAHAVLGDGCILHHHAVVEGFTTLGRENEIFPFACIGMKTQDLKYRGGSPGVKIGDRNVFREYVSVHGATNDGDYTVMGSDNLLLAYCHVAHDCQLGSHIIASNDVGLAGHVIVEDYVTLGAKSGVHQFCRVGTHAMLGAMSKIVQDVPPYIIADGAPAVARSINKIGLERHDFQPERVEAIKQAFRVFYRAGYNRSQAFEHMHKHAFAEAPDFRHFLTFVEESERGVIAGR